MSYVCPPPYKAPHPGGKHRWIVLTSRRTRYFRWRWLARLVAFFVQRMGPNEPASRLGWKYHGEERRLPLTDGERRELGRQLSDQARRPVPPQSTDVRNMPFGRWR